ncbi:unnamed protein product [Protopolystoma xenopodis]|uniref:Uncharacterized protein n=1 Tax=Protopolystoma xenopodis TaxID=117903 RepID=A0A3S5FG43_9PLAT|nr:unnamed protein product [Protopolystoma xenopodis]
MLAATSAYPDQTLLCVFRLSLDRIVPRTRASSSPIQRASEVHNGLHAERRSGSMVSQMPHPCDPETELLLTPHLAYVPLRSLEEQLRPSNRPAAFASSCLLLAKPGVVHTQNRDGPLAVLISASILVFRSPQCPVARSAWPSWDSSMLAA